MLRTYPAVPLFFCSLTLLCAYFSTHLPCCALIFFFTLTLLCTCFSAHFPILRLVTWFSKLRTLKMSLLHCPFYFTSKFLPATITPWPQRLLSRSDYSSVSARWPCPWSWYSRLVASLPLAISFCGLLEHVKTVCAILTWGLSLTRPGSGDVNLPGKRKTIYFLSCPVLSSIDGFLQLIEVTFSQ